MVAVAVDQPPVERGVAPRVEGIDRLGQAEPDDVAELLSRPRFEPEIGDGPLDARDDPLGRICCAD